ncbi:MAG: DNA-processing protein DprA [candidate division Zixibacteria bacterium]|nr:DNA-processing protein DprA [candidate division Zixibacteria bacterium]
MKRAEEYSIATQIWALRQHGEVGPRTFRALMIHFGYLSAILEAELDELKGIEGLGAKKSQKIFDSFAFLDKAEEFIGALKVRNIGISTIFDEDYPQLFMELNDPPPIIFYRGRLPDNNEKTVAIVGSRKATSEGMRIGVDLALGLARKSIAIVSGLARGIDASAHIGALKADGRTYAVIGSGFDHIFPEENRPLAAELVQTGGLISEYPPEERYVTGHLVARNRLTVGISKAVVIGEIFNDSTGTLDTATFCQELGKWMFIVIDGCDQPGRDNSGVEKVLSLGAIPINSKDGIDIILKSLV